METTRREASEISYPTSESRRFLHVHHYKAWAHNSTPSSLEQLWQIQSSLRQYSSPPVYMSLSGCGRAGTYALFEAAHSSLHSENPSFDMVKCLENVRRYEQESEIPFVLDSQRTPPLGAEHQSVLVRVHFDRRTRPRQCNDSMSFFFIAPDFRGSANF